MENIPYSSAVGSIMYAQVCTRPDIAYILGIFCRYLSKPGLEYWKAVKRVLRYLKRTKEYMLTYRRSDILEVIGYANHAGCTDSMRSTSDYVYLLAGGAATWRSVKHSLIATSTMAVEFISCFEASEHGIWLRNFITGLRVVNSIGRPMKLYCDDQSAVMFANNNRSSTKSKHIDIKFLAIKERVHNGHFCY
ncbi:secreted RxLR effector protein 161-like [Rutidosis leptorrhynchoides]|uniref:secreted RxLR effector protein 161-like n=1 Tax=Rutidosis leptorrhynchoides TaxID=125765 RepID=UPI003A9A158E